MEILTGSFMPSKSNSSPNNLSAFVILSGLWSAGCNHLTKHHLKHSVSANFKY